MPAAYIYHLPATVFRRRWTPFVRSHHSIPSSIMRRPLDFSRREFVLLALLVLCILFFAHSSPPSYSNVRYSDSDVEALDGIPELPWDNAEVHVPRPIKPAAQFPTHTVSWTNAMPETTIVQHVAGEPTLLLFETPVVRLRQSRRPSCDRDLHRTMFRMHAMLVSDRC